MQRRREVRCHRQVPNQREVSGRRSRSGFRDWLSEYLRPRKRELRKRGSLKTLVRSRRREKNGRLRSPMYYVAGIPTFGPIVSWLFRDIRNPSNGLHILQTKFHGHQQTERCSMLHGEGLTVKVCGEQRLWVAGRRQVDRHKVRVRIPRRIEIDRRLHVRPFRLRHRWVGAKQIASYVGAGSVRGIQR
jgi:hypothetical protein